MENRRTLACFAGLMLALSLVVSMLAQPPARASAAAEPLQVAYVYSQQCLSCEHVWPTIKQALDDAPAPVSLSRYEINTREGAEYARSHGIVSIPALIINCGPPMLFENYNSTESFDRALRARIACETGAGPCNNVTPHSCTTVKKMTKLSASAAFIAGLIAGINPCLLAVMAFIAGTTISAAGRSFNILARIVSFCGGLLAVYLFIGIGLMELMRLVPGLDLALKGAIIVILTAMAAWSFFDAYRVKRGFESRSFKTVLRRFGRSYEKYAVLASFGIGAAFGLVKMPCVGGLYIAILGTVLQSDRVAEGLLYLVIYNLGVITPVIALGGLLAFGLSPGAVNAFRLRHRVKLKVFTGALLAAMAAGFALGAI